MKSNITKMHGQQHIKICCSVHTMRLLIIQYALKQTEACTTT